MHKWLRFLTANDMVHNKAVVGERACLAGWIGRQSETTAERHLLVRAVAHVIKCDESWEHNCMHIASYNDAHSLARNAEVWNEAMRHAGLAPVEQPAEQVEELVHA